jgi:hypothetical protein
MEILRTGLVSLRGALGFGQRWWLVRGGSTAQSEGASKCAHGRI